MYLFRHSVQLHGGPHHPSIASQPCMLHVGLVGSVCVGRWGLTTVCICMCVLTHSVQFSHLQDGLIPNCKLRAKQDLPQEWKSALYRSSKCGQVGLCVIICSTAIVWSLPCCWVTRDAWGSLFAGLCVSYMWPDLGKPSVWDPCVIRTMHVFSSSGRNLSKSRFCHIHVEQPFLLWTKELIAFVYYIR